MKRAGKGGNLAWRVLGGRFLSMPRKATERLLEPSCLFQFVAVFAGAQWRWMNGPEHTLTWFLSGEELFPQEFTADLRRACS